ncbi:MAG: endolytic transglycosylase MltG [Lachnospiraceae bacterium]|nr:endolytic transglycosylase MltG [Lachnospiraceae bacterium]
MRKKKKKQSGADKIVIGMSSGFIRLCVEVVFYFLAVVAVIQLSVYAKGFCYQLFGNVSVADAEHSEEKEFYIEIGDSTRDVCKRLEREGLIVNELSFYVKIKINKYVVNPGTYKLSTSMNYNDIMNKIATPSEEIEDDVPLDEDDEGNL